MDPPKTLKHIVSVEGCEQLTFNITISGLLLQPKRGRNSRKIKCNRMTTSQALILLTLLGYEERNIRNFHEEQKPSVDVLDNIVEIYLDADRKQADDETMTVKKDFDEIDNDKEKTLIVDMDSQLTERKTAECVAEMTQSEENVETTTVDNEMCHGSVDLVISDNNTTCQVDSFNVTIENIFIDDDSILHDLNLQEIVADGVVLDEHVVGSKTGKRKNSKNTTDKSDIKVKKPRKTKSENLHKDPTTTDKVKKPRETKTEKVAKDPKTNQFLCTTCGYQCKQKFTLQNHIVMKHTHEHQHKCPYCEYGATTTTRIARHMAYRHTGDKPYHCTKCNFMCVEAASLKSHMNIHTGDRPYKCDMCDYACRHSSTLSEHKKRHRGERPHACPFCEYTAVKTGEIQRHVRKHTKEKPYLCEYCEFRAATSFTLNNHIRVKHLTIVNHKQQQVNLDQAVVESNHNNNT